jgi:hypothetical protein
VSHAAEGPPHFAFAVAFAVARSLYPNQKTVISTEAAHAFVSSAVEKSASSPRTLHEIPHSIAFAATAIFLFSFSAQKSHVKPQNHLNPTNKQDRLGTLVRFNSLY